MGLSDVAQFNCEYREGALVAATANALVNLHPSEASLFTFGVETFFAP